MLRSGPKLWFKWWFGLGQDKKEKKGNENSTFMHSLVFLYGSTHSVSHACGPYLCGPTCHPAFSMFSLPPWLAMMEGPTPGLWTRHAAQQLSSANFCYLYLNQHWRSLPSSSFFPDKSKGLPWAGPRSVATRLWYMVLGDYWAGFFWFILWGYHKA